MRDQYGLFVQANGDTGDATHRTGTAYAITGLLGESNRDIENALHHVELFDQGAFIRHPSGTAAWHSDPQCLSRDQASRLILGYAVNNDKSIIKSWLFKMLKRGFFHQNNKHYETGKYQVPDIMGLGEVRNVIRGLDAWYLYPLLVLLDCFFISDILTRNKWDGASLFLPDIKYAKSKYPTPAVYLADKLSQLTGCYEEALNNHAAKNNGCVELQELFSKLKDL